MGVRAFVQMPQPRPGKAELVLQQAFQLQQEREGSKEGRRKTDKETCEVTEVSSKAQFDKRLKAFETRGAVLCGRSR